MATIAEVRFRISDSGENVAVHIGYDVLFDSFDVASNQVYQQSWSVSCVRGRECRTEHNPLDVVRFAADGSPSVSRIIESVIRREQQDTELIATVTLTPVGPFGDSAQSNRVKIGVE